MKTRTATRRYTARPELRNAIVRQGRMASWFAEVLGVSAGHFSKILAGRRPVDERDARWMAAVLGADVAVLFNGPDGPLAVPDGEAA